jgi:predicted DNA-binding transcriptional regulator AlpA
MFSSNRIRRVRAMPLVSSTKPARHSSHVLPRSPVIDINGPGRLRTAHVLALCGFSHSTLYTRLKSKVFPPPDGMDGGLNYWNTQTIRAFLGNTSGMT